MKAAGYEAVILRAHNGWRADSRWAANAATVSKLFSWWGAYQYLPASVDPRTAAAEFTSTLGSYKPNLVVLDLEEGAGDQGPRQRAWLSAMNHGPEWTYSGLYFARNHGLTGVQWIAAYKQPSEPTAWHELWQYTGGGRTVPGIAGGVDASIFHGTLSGLMAITSGSLPAPAPTGGTDFMATIEQADWDALIWRVEALVNREAKMQGSTLAGTSVKFNDDFTALKAEIDEIKTALAGIPTVTATVDVEAIAEAVFQRLKAQIDKP